MESPRRIPVFRPTLEEFKNFGNYVKYIERLGAHKAGLAKIIPPSEWNPQFKDLKILDEVVVKRPLTQSREKHRTGLFSVCNTVTKPVKVKELKALDSKLRSKYLKKKNGRRKSHWSTIVKNKPIYGADIHGTLFSKSTENWNLNNLRCILDRIKPKYREQLPGVLSPYLYIGTYGTTFAAHTEDFDLYSISYLHFGYPKVWYAIPPAEGEKFEKLMKTMFPDDFKECPTYMRHKAYLPSPGFLKKHGITVNSVSQKKREFIITFPYGYHSGYNAGYNCAEAVNFALPRWVEYGKRATICKCRKNDAVEIPMKYFIRKYQIENYRRWRERKDIGPHPESEEYRRKHGNIADC